MIPPRAWYLIALVALIAIAYHGVSTHDFVYLDDGPYLFQNGWTAQGLTLDSIWHHLTHTTGGQYMPVTMISYLPLVSLFGNTAPPQLWFNVFLHAANALLIVWVLHKYIGRFWPAACVATLFALHPIHVESVAWATERKDVLFLFFGLLTLGTYANYTRNPSPARYLLALGLFALSLLSKSMLVTMPALLLLLDIWPLGRVPKVWSPIASPSDPEPGTRNPKPAFLILEKLPFALLAAAMAYITVKSTGGSGGVASAEALPYDLRIGLAVNGYFDYLSSLFYPVDLCGLYPIPKYFEKSDVILRAVGLLIITALALWQFKKRPYLLIGWLWYLGTLAPVSGIMQAGNQCRADRFVYWPFLGIYIALIYLAFDLFASRSSSSTRDAGHGIQDDPSASSTSSTSPSSPATSHSPLPTLPNPFPSLLLIPLALLLTALSYKQVAYWADSEVFFKRILSVTTKNPQAHSALAVYYVDKKRLPEAEEQFRLTLQIDPQDAPSLVSLAELAMQAGHVDQAVPLLQQVLALPSKPGEAASNAAFLLLQLGQGEKAAALVRESLKNKPNSPVVQTNAGIIYVALGSPDVKEQGLRLLHTALESSPGDPGILTNLGAAYANMKRYDDAQKQFVRAIESKPDDMRAYPLLGHLYKITGHPEQARAIYQAGLAIDPNDTACREGLATLNR